ncbi:hypothetical protein Dimus_003250 [Dionaea muscipula]
MLVIHLKKKDVVKSKVRGVEMEFDHEKLETILGEKFYDAEDKDQGSPDVNEKIPAATPQSSAQQKEQETSGVDPSSPPSRIPEAVMTKLQAEFERKRANRFLADLEKAKAENARLLALLHQAQSKPQP